MLIDTHILLWTLEGKAGRMGAETVQRMQKDFDQVFVSAASLFEIRLKQRRGGLLQFDLNTLISNLQSHTVTMLAVTSDQLSLIPDRDTTEHADPFDLLLIAQAIAEKVPLVTCDEKILKLGLPGLRLIDGRM